MAAGPLLPPPPPPRNEATLRGSGDAAVTAAAAGSEPRDPVPTGPARLGPALAPGRTPRLFRGAASDNRTRPSGVSLAPADTGYPPRRACHASVEAH